jgi:hypothetical protein
LLPPKGVCTTYTETMQSGDLLTSLSLAGLLAGRALDAGSRLKIVGPKGQREIGRARQGQAYVGELGGRTIGAASSTPLFLEPGSYEIQGTGGKDVGSFRSVVRARPPVVWWNEAQVDTVDRAAGVVLHWTGAAKEDRVAIVAVNHDRLTGAAGICLCLPPPGADTFAIPPMALTNFPASPQAGHALANFLALFTLAGNEQRFQAKGLDGGAAGWATVSAKAVLFR